MRHKILESIRKTFSKIRILTGNGLTFIMQFAKRRKILFTFSVLLLLFLGTISIYFLFFRSAKCTYGNCNFGFGAKEFRNGTRYAGEFYSGKYNGIGTIRNPEGHSYEGEWKLGKKHGKGKYVYPDGSIYQGEFVEDVKQGLGVFIWPDQTKLSARFINGEPEGKGILILPNEIEFVGEYKNGIIYQGKGIYVYDDGSKYMGEWLQGKRHGKGTLLSETGNILFIGEWENDHQKKAMSLNDAKIKK